MTYHNIILRDEHIVLLYMHFDVMLKGLFILKLPFIKQIFLWKSTIQYRCTQRSNAMPIPIHLNVMMRVLSMYKHLP